MRGPETIYAWRYTGSHHEGQWNRSKLSHAEAKYIRADIADARVAAAYEAAAKFFDGAEADLLAEGDKNGARDAALDAKYIRALTPDDAKAALEAVRREARAEALRGVLSIANDAKALCEAGHPVSAFNLASQILAMIDKETTE